MTDYIFYFGDRYEDMTDYRSYIHNCQFPPILALNTTCSLCSFVRYQVKHSKIYSTRAHVLSSNYKTPKVSLTKLTVYIPTFPSLKFRKIWQAGSKYFILVGRLKTEYKRHKKLPLQALPFRV